MIDREECFKNFASRENYLYERTGQSEDHVYYLLSIIETCPGLDSPWSKLLPRKIIGNPAIKDQFINIVADLLNTNFKSESVITTINEITFYIGKEIC